MRKTYCAAGLRPGLCPLWVNSAASHQPNRQCMSASPRKRTNRRASRLGLICATSGREQLQKQASAQVGLFDNLVGAREKRRLCFRGPYRALTPEVFNLLSLVMHT